MAMEDAQRHAPLMAQRPRDALRAKARAMEGACVPAPARCSWRAPARPQSDGFVTVEDGVRLYYRIEGSGPETLVVVHGGPGFSLELVTGRFRRRSHRTAEVIYYDQRGNGRRA